MTRLLKSPDVALSSQREEDPQARKGSKPRLATVSTGQCPPVRHRVTAAHADGAVLWSCVDISWVNKGVTLTSCSGSFHRRGQEVGPGSGRRSSALGCLSGVLQGVRPGLRVSRGAVTDS